MLPKKIHSIWLGSTIPADLRDCLGSVSAFHSDWDHIIWNADMLEAQGIDVYDLKRQYKGWASVSNVARLMLLWELGGIYLDCDIRCHRSMEPWLYNEAFIAPQRDGRLCNAVMGAYSHHPWIERQINDCENWKASTAEWGVYAATRASREGVNVRILPTEQVYPYCYTDAPDRRIVGPEAITEHLWKGEHS